ncbi:basic blue protein [Iris pallida]|uniref:Plantacyanin n=1 Tax=Iris pallida TaxID=29817 RepID=A0AAX6I688_IRIPA|nr:basic blue protein [Iris pallida]KAJ6848840.1 basic blue protein [Iris pallida]
MAQGSDSARATAVVMIALLCVLQLHVAESAVYVVGGGSGWTFNSAGWTKGKRFRAGDVLVFNYNSAVHNVVAVSAAGYKGCSTPRGSSVLTTGKDRVTLRKGTNYFICNFAGHCQAGMKMAVTAV